MIALVPLENKLACDVEATSVTLGAGVVSTLVLDSEDLSADPGRRKFAVVASLLGKSEGTSFFPKAIPTIAVMCVSGPNTNKGIPRF